MIRTHFHTVGALTGALLLGMSACGDDPPTGGGEAEVVTVSLTTPSSDDGALLITVTGPGLDDVRPASASYRLFWRAVSANEARVIVVGNIAAGPIFTAAASKGEPASDFAASVVDVSSRSEDLRASVAGYSLRVTR